MELEKLVLWILQIKLRQLFKFIQNMEEVVFEMTISIKSNGGIWSKASHSMYVCFTKTRRVTHKILLHASC